ncbi:Transposable element Tcb2 transposase [Araneus ventricosus]|uniref:Transposable element Tcb2 transposase n=1 Tax=Araneus ventricosus TaxID=182803 RepID=A0A4Y2T0S1_ARAVE|nr:Transposable element Tcb2 transposase [Araneus ventricosus]
MIWGCLNGSGLVSATLCDNQMKSQHYLNVVNDQVIPSMDFFFPYGTGIYQNDNFKIHRALIIYNWFREHENSLSHTDWPPQSPYLHPIENIWDILEHRLRDGSFLQSSVQCLGDKLLQIWTTISAETIQNLIETMPRRRSAVIQAKRCPTKY